MVHDKDTENEKPNLINPLNIKLRHTKSLHQYPLTVYIQNWSVCLLAGCRSSVAEHLCVV